MFAFALALLALHAPAPPDVDTDGDGLSDFQERHKYLTDPTSADSDGDGVPDGDLDERREFTYSVRTIVRVMKPVDVAAACDDYQDARLLDESEDRVLLEVVHYPLGRAATTIGADSKWRESVRSDELAPYLESTPTSCFDRAMRDGLREELAEAGVDWRRADDRALVVATARVLMGRSTFEDGFTAFLADFRDGQPVVLPELEDKVRKLELEFGHSIEGQWRRELLATGMYEQRVHGSCTSSAIYLCGGLRAVGIPTRIVLSIPLVDANDPLQLAMVERGIRDGRVREIALAGLRPLADSWASHTFLEVWIDGRWRRMNYTFLGQPILDKELYGLTTHVLTVRDWSEARMGRTIGRRQALSERDEEFRTQNPYATLEVTDRYGEHIRDEDATLLLEAPIEEMQVQRAFWAASSERPANFEPTGIDLEGDRLHVFLEARPANGRIRFERVDTFWHEAPRAFRLVPENGNALPVRAVRGFWIRGEVPEVSIYFVLRLGPDARASMKAGTTYSVVHASSDEGPRFTVGEGVTVRVPK